MSQTTSTVFGAVAKRIPKTPDTAWGFILYLLRHCPTRMKWQAVGASLFEMVGHAGDVLLTWSLGRIVGVLIAATPSPGPEIWTPIGYELMLFTGIWFMRGAGFRMREFLDRRYVPILLNTTRELLFSRLIQQSQYFLQSNFAGVLANHVRRAGDVIGALREKIQHNILPLLTRFTMGGVLLWPLSPKLTLFVFASIVICMVGAILTAPRWTRLSTRNAEAASRLTGYIVDSVTNLNIVQQNVGWPEEKRRLGSAHAEITTAYRDRLLYVSWFWGSFDFIMTFFYLGFMSLVVYSWQTGDVSPAELGMAVGLVTSLFGALAGTVALLSSKFDDIGILQESLQKISTPLSVIDRTAAPELLVTQGEIEFRDVVFDYPNGQSLFRGLNLTISAGQKVGLVGISGAGKTSLCQLLLRSYDLKDGAIYIDGQSIAETTLDSLHAAIAVIPQEPAMFHRSLADNIGYGRADATRADIENAARAAEAADFIAALSEGYDTLVGERGVKLSGGQRQRVAIARAIVKNAPILILDEATSALDSATEMHIQRAMATAMQGRTTIVIAHRLSTLSHMDRIIVMEKGQIVEDGTFNSLMASQGTFAKLWALQAGGFLPEAYPGKAPVKPPIEPVA